MVLVDAVCELIAQRTGVAARVAHRRGLGGGCINNAEVFELEDRRRFFVKHNPSPLPGMFAAEAAGLEALRAVGAIRVPEAIGTGGGEGSGVDPFVVLEFIETGRPAARFFEDFGYRFAQLHQRSQGERFGFDGDNYIGSTPQPNGWGEDWVAFWRERRLGFQLDLARRNGHADAAMMRAGERLMARLDELIGQPDEPACLLHGDLWSGNFLADKAGRPVLIDPAAYYGRREADLAMTQLFGGFDAAFYHAYEEVWPLAPGSADRIAIYKLYHLLNHLNLFGASYHDGCMAILRRFG